MKRTPIIVQGQVYLHAGYNEYLVVVKVNRTDISFKGPGFSGMNEAELFLERFGPVDPVDLSADERTVLEALIPSSSILSVGWVERDDDDEDDEEY
jgi:hypothetical protein